MSQNGTRRRRRHSLTAVVAVVVAVVAVAGAAGGYLLLRTTDSPQQIATSYLGDWQRGSYPAMDTVSVDVPQAGLPAPLGRAAPLGRGAAELGTRRLLLVLRGVTVSGGSAQARFTATADLASGHAWTYQGQLQLVQQSRRWREEWSPAAIRSQE